MIENKKNKSMTSKREKQTRYLSQAIQLEEAVNPHIIKTTMTMVSLALLVFICWAALTNINEVARTPGEIVPQGYQKTIQHLEGGIVKHINVKDGDIVAINQSLITINGASLQEDYERAEGKKLSLEMQAERLRAFVDGRQPDFSGFHLASDKMIKDQESYFLGMKTARDKEEAVILNQITDKKHNINAINGDLQTANSNLSITDKVYQKRDKLNKQGYASDMQLLEDKRNLNQAQGTIRNLENQMITARGEIKQYQNRLASLSAQHRDEALEKLDNVESQIAENRQIIEKLMERITRLDVRSPVRGLVKGMNINTVGSVIQPGQIIMEVIPLDKNLEVAVKISPQDIGHLKIGQDVQVKFSTFDFSRYGFITGRLDQISAATFSGDKGERYYHGRITLPQNYVGTDKDNIILPGMTVMADVITGNKTILEYMLKPIHLSIKSAFKER